MSDRDPSSRGDDTGVDAFLGARTAAPRGFAGDRGVTAACDVSGTTQLHVVGVDDVADRPVRPGPATAVTDHVEPVDGRGLPARGQLLVAADVGGDERTQLFVCEPPSGGPLGADRWRPVAVDPAVVHRAGDLAHDGARLPYATNRRDGVRFDVVVHDLDRGDERIVWQGGSAFPSTWSPDDRLLALHVRTDRPGDDRLLLIEPARPDADAVELLGHADGPAATVGAPRWLPDTSACLVTSSVGRETSVVRRIEVVDGTVADPSGEVVVDHGWDVDIALDPTGRHLLVAANADGVTTAELRATGSMEVVRTLDLPGEGVASDFAFSPDGRLLTYGFSSALVPGDVWCHDTVTHRSWRVTASPCPVDPRALVAPTRADAVADDGLEVPLWVYRPPTPGPHPVVVAVHGGPESQWRPRFHPLAQSLVADGVAVVAPNVRGSTGYGRTYASLDDVGLRADAVDDLAAVHDWVAGRSDLDADRCALFGRSYGGYMVLAGLVRHPDRWAAGVSVVGIANLVTFLERTSAYRRAWREPEYGSLDRDRALLTELSPITHVDRLAAPLLLVHGRNDPRVPVGEAEQIHAVARSRGLRSELHVYDREGHRLRRPDNRRHAARRVAGFLHDTLRPSPAADG